jgi:pyridoxal/pyridoxine/pyridoxamine kinase
LREIAILERIVGDSNKHVARFFDIAEATVKAHVKAIFRNSTLIYCCDPVIGDAGRGVFVERGLPELFRDRPCAGKEQLSCSDLTGLRA